MPLYGYVAMLVQANLFISSALSSFDAQRWRPTTSFCATMSPYDIVEISDKRGSKCPKKPPNSPFCSALPSIVSACAPPMAPSLNPATKSGELISPIGLFVIDWLFRKLPEFCVIRLGWRTWSLHSSNRHTRLSWGLHGDIYGRRKEGVGIASSCRQSHL